MYGINQRYIYIRIKINENRKYHFRKIERIFDMQLERNDERKIKRFNKIET